MTKGNLGPVFWCVFCLLSNVYAAPRSCPEAFSKLFADLARERGIGSELLDLLDRAAPASFEFRRDGFPTGGEDGAKVFKMGDFGEREVKLTKPIEMQATMVTQFQYVLAMEENPSRAMDGQFLFFRGDRLPVGKQVRLNLNRPVVMVSWEDALAFIQRLNKLQDEYTYSLPTEAEWEFAARGGTDTRYWFGDSEAKLVDYAWFYNNSDGQTHSVAQLPANPLGLYDVYGNAAEWTADWFEKLPAGKVTDPTGPGAGLDRVIRGGHWTALAPDLRSAHRGHINPRHGYSYVGLRLIRTPR